MTKIIFLDIDGPMIPVRAYFLPKQTKPAKIFDPCAVAMLNKLIKASDAKLVISSTWANKGKRIVSNMLAKNGIDTKHLHRDWTTPRKFSSQRIHEIKWWLDEHPEVTHHVAIDDEELVVEFVPNAVQCDAHEGFSFRNMLEATLMLEAFDKNLDRDKQIESIEEHIVFSKRKEIWRLARPSISDDKLRAYKSLTWEVAVELAPSRKKTND